MQPSPPLNPLLSRRFAQNFLPIPATNRFPIGTVAPPFELPDGAGAKVRLRDYLGQPVLLAFTRIFTEQHYCPFCFPHLLALSATYAQFQQQGAEVLLISSTDLAQSQVVQRELGLKMPLLSDASCRSFRLYQTGQALGAPLPAQFLLDAAGRIRFRHLFSFIEPNASIQRLLTALSALP